MNTETDREYNPSQTNYAELVVGVTSWQDEATIAQVTERCACALKQLGRQGVIINSGSDSIDNTAASFMQADSHGVARIQLAGPPGQVGKGFNMRQILIKAVQLEAKAVAIVEADDAFLQPDHIVGLLEPVLHGFDLCTPLYLDTNKDLVSNLAVYPLVRCLWGRRVQRPDASRRGLSARHIHTLLNYPWPQVALDQGADLWSTVSALNFDLPVCQTYIDSLARPGHDFRSIMEVLFKLCGENAKWQQVKGSRPTAFYGEPIRATRLEEDANLSELELQLEENINNAWDFFLHFKETSSLLQEVKNNNIGPLFWARLLLSSLKLYRFQPQLLEQLMLALEPFFWGRVVNFLKQPERLEKLIENQCLVFEENKLYYL